VALPPTDYLSPQFLYRDYISAISTLMQVCYPADLILFMAIFGAFFAFFPWVFTVFSRFCPGFLRFFEFLA
jgi:hypothetical protein